MTNAKVRPIMDGVRIREKPVDGNPIGMVHTRDSLDALEPADITKQKVGTAGQWLQVRTPAGLIGFVAAEFLALESIPETASGAASAAEEPLYLKPTTEGLRVRDKAVTGKPIGQLYNRDTIQSLEPVEDTKAKIGSAEAWINIRTDSGLTGFAAAKYLQLADAPTVTVQAQTAAPAEATAQQTPSPVSAKTNILGMNLDVFHPLGLPDPSRLGGLGWVRFGYNVSMGKGSQDIDEAYRVYRPIAEKYARAGYKVLFTFTHQTYGEGVNEFWPWPNMTDGKWQILTTRFTDMIGRIVKQYAGQNIVHAWQIWNEQDAPIGAVASVPMSPANYAHLLAESIRTIRAIDPTMLVITGGHTGGPGPGSNYAAATIKALPAGILPDGIASHPYGRGTTPGDRYCNWGHIEDELKAYSAILPNKPIWLTEWGALDKEGDPADKLAQYAADFMNYVQQRYPGKVAAAIWYAWAMGMHNGYGLVGRDDKPVQPFHDRFLALRVEY